MDHDILFCLSKQVEKAPFANVYWKKPQVNTIFDILILANRISVVLNLSRAMLLSLFVNRIVPAITIPFWILDFVAILTMLLSQKLRQRNASIFLVTIFLADMLMMFFSYYTFWMIKITEMNMTTFYNLDKITYKNETGKFSKVQEKLALSFSHWNYLPQLHTK